MTYTGHGEGPLSRWEGALYYGALFVVCGAFGYCFATVTEEGDTHRWDYCDRALATAHTGSDSTRMYAGHWHYCVR